MAVPLSGLLTFGAAMATGTCGTSDQRLLCTSQNFVYLPWAGLAVAIALFITGGALRTRPRSTQESGVHWIFLLAGVLTWIVSWCAAAGIANEPPT